MAIQADIRIYGITDLSQAARACEWCASGARDGSTDRHVVHF